MQTGSLPAWLEHILAHSTEKQVDDGMLPRFENKDFCLEASQVIHPDCPECESQHVTLLGTFCFDNHGLYLDVKCHHCGHLGDSGDGDFFEYYHIEDGMIVHKPID